MILAIYGDSIIFIFTTAMLEHGFGLNTSMAICDTAILLCLVCYMSTKVCGRSIYLVRDAHGHIGGASCGGRVGGRY